MTNHTCNNCEHWRKGDVSNKQIANVGQCAFMTPRTPLDLPARKDKSKEHVVFYTRAKHVPFWADGFTKQTSSYDGESCGVFKKASPARLKMNTV